MPRKLPWKTPGNTKQEAAASSPLRTPKGESSGFPTASPRSTPRTAPQARRAAPRAHFPLDSSDPIRSPSTSPPPEPPKEEFMIPSDDRYRMVEDELLQIAQRFTTHLHRAEYTRLKALAKSQNAAAIREIERPVVPGSTPTTAARHSRARSKQLAKQRSVIAGGDEETASSGLRGMLDAPRGEQRALPRFAAGGGELAASGTTTRAAAGFRSNRVIAEGQAVRMSANQQPVRHLNLSPGVGPSSAAVRSRPTPVVRMDVVDTDTGEEDDDDDPFGMTKRRINRQKSREQVKTTIERPPPPKKEPSPDTMPFFV